MFREMRRKKQALSEQRTADIMRTGTSGVLALAEDGGYPYAVPISYVYDDNNEKIYFHCAKATQAGAYSKKRKGVFLCR